MTTLRAALLLALSREHEARWRQAMVVAATLATTFVLLCLASLLAATHQSDATADRRNPTWSTPGGPAPIMASSRAIVVDGHQWPVLWLEPRGPVGAGYRGAPPGLSRLPGPGEAVVSPGLAARGITAQALGMRPSTAGTGVGGAIGDEGLRTRSEGLVYAVPAPGRTLGTGGALFGIQGWGPGLRMMLDDTPDIPSHRDLLVGSLLLVVVPALYLLVSGARAASPVRTARAATLFRLGVAPRRVRALLALEGALLAVAGSALGGILWLVLARGRVDWPGVDATLVPGATDLAPAPAAGVVAAVMAVVAASSAAVRVPPRDVRRSGRPLRVRSLTPVALGVLLMAVARWSPWFSTTRMLLLVGGALLVLAGAPAAVPAVAQRLAPVLGRVGAASAWLAAARLRTRAQSLARPALMVAVLVFVAGAGQAFYQYALTVEPEQQGLDGQPVVASVSWRGPRPGDLPRALGALGRDGITAVALRGDRAVVASCTVADAMAAVAHVPRGCEQGRLSSALVRWVKSASGVDVTLARPAGSEYEVLVVAPNGTTDARISRALAGLPALNIAHTDQSDKPSSAPPGWIMLAWFTGIACAALGLVREIGDRALLAAVEDRPLDRLGLPARGLDVVHWLTVGLPVLVAAAMGWVAAVAFALIGSELGFTVANVWAVTQGTLAASVGAMAALALALVATRRAAR